MTPPQVEQRVYIHVGVPKSGTTFLQTSLSKNRTQLRELGIRYPGGDDRMFLAAIDVRGISKAWGRKRAEAAGSWDDLCDRARKHSGVTVISHELLAAAGHREIAASMSMLKGLDVHLVVTARDPGRQVTAEWQEGVKHGRRLTFKEFQERVLDDRSETEYARKFRAAQDLPAILARWGASLRPDHVHVVSCPPDPAPRELLWERFAGVIGFDPAQLPAAGRESTNPSLGTDEVDLLRRVNVALGKRIAQPDYGLIVKQVFAQSLLREGSSAKPVMPADLHGQMTRIAEGWAKEIDRAGWCMHGRPDDLLPAAPTRPNPHPDTVNADSQVQTCVAAITDLLLEIQRGRHENVRLQTALEAAETRRKKQRKKLRRRLREATDRQ